MANSSTKVKFHPLERLDKVDVEATQNLAHNHADNYVGGLVGTTGILDTPSTITINNNTELISLSDCSWLGWQAHHDGLTGSKYSACYGFYKSVDSRNGDIDFDALRATVQAYYTTNGVLPISPLDAAFVDSTHGFAYPFVYALTTKVEAVTEARRFWSTANATETTDNVSTEEQQVHTFAFAAAADAAPVGGDFPAVKILKIVAWEINSVSGVVDLLTVIPVQLADNILNISPYYVAAAGNPNGGITASGKEGISAAIAWLKNRQDAIVDGGLHDLPTTTTGISDHTIPRFSLHGLEKYLGDRIASLENSVKRATAIVKTRYNKLQGIQDVTVHPFQDNDFSVFAFTDFSFMFDTTATGGTLHSAPFDPFALTQADIQDVERFLGALFISIPSEYAGWGIQMNLTPVMPQQDYGYLYNISGVGQEDGDVQEGSTAQKRGLDDAWIINPGVGHVPGDNNVQVWANTMNRVSPSWAKTRDNVTYYTSNLYHGVSIAHPMAYNAHSVNQLDNSCLNDLAAIATLYLKVDITLIRP
jgi:hypothetical protein